MNLEYIRQKINIFTNGHSIEESARLYLLGLGFDRVCECKSRYAIDYIKEKYNGEKFKNLFDVLWNQKNGIPDLVAVKDGEIVFVEVKRTDGNYDDSISQNQLKWIKEHPQFRVIILAFELEVKDNDKFLEIETLKHEIKELEDLLNKLRNEREIDENMLSLLDQLETKIRERRELHKNEERTERSI